MFVSATVFIMQTDGAEPHGVAHSSYGNGPSPRSFRAAPIYPYADGICNRYRRMED